MFVYRVLHRVSRTVSRSSTLLSASQRHSQHLSTFSNHFHSLLPQSQTKLIQVQANLLYPPVNPSLAPRFGFSSSASPGKKEKANNVGDSTNDDLAKTSVDEKEIDQGEQAKGADQREESGSASDSQSQTSKRRRKSSKRVAFSEKEKHLNLKHKGIEKMQDKVLRTYAEMENVMDRTRRESENSKKFAIQNFAKSLLYVVENLGRASSVVKESFSKIGASNYSFETVKLLKTLSEVSPTSIIDGLKKLYLEKLKPLEVTYHFNDFVSPLLTNSDFEAKPMVMLLGQYSTGKTTFIKQLLKSNYPGAHIGPEPTTDRFVAIMSGPDERTIPGNTVAVQADLPFSGLTTFGTTFLSKFECAQMPHPLLDQITFVDSPGVLSGEKQRTQRAYDFTGVTTWFASKCDLILLLFDPYKLDISDEFKRVISSLHGNHDKIRVVLNKADQVDTQQLMRVYGALMWSLGKVLNTPEVTRVYVGSFIDKPVNEAVGGPIGRELFKKEQDDLLSDLKDIPKMACDRRINEFVKRARAAKIHALIISHLKNEMPILMGKAKAQERLIDNLAEEFEKVQREFRLPPGDFPDVEHFREILRTFNIDNFKRLKPKMIKAVDDMLAYDIPNLLENFKNTHD